MKQRIFIISILIVISTIILMALNLSDNSPNKKKNGFIRNFKLIAPEEINRAQFDIQLYRFFEKSNDSIFFSGSSPDKVYMTNIQLNKLDTFHITIPSIKDINTNFYTFVKFPIVNILAGNARYFIQTNIVTKKQSILKLSTGGSFSKVVQISENTYIALIIDSLSLNARFKKINTITGVTSFNDDLIPLLGDAGFTFDGTLNFSRSTNLLVYVPFYNNNLIAFDTSLNLIYKSNTRDSFRTPRKQFVKVGHSITHNAPPIMINAHTWVFSDKLYVHSKIKADNEDMNTYDENWVIDIYELKNGIYLESFYVPKIKGQKLFGFGIINQKSLMALYNNEIILYNIIK